MAWDSGATNLTDQAFPAEISASNDGARIGSAILDPRFTGIVHIAHEVSPVSPVHPGIRYMQYDMNNNRIVREVYIETPDGVNDWRGPGLAFDPVEERLWCVYFEGASTNLYTDGPAQYIYASYSNDNGASWSTRQLIDSVSSGGWYNTDRAVRQGMSVDFGWDGTGIALAYYDTTPDLVTAWHYSPDSGWGSRVTVASIGGAGSVGGRGCSVAVGPTGEAVAVVSNCVNGTNTPRVFIHTYNPDTATWSGGQLMQSHNANYTVFLKARYNTPRNEFDVVWGLYGAGNLRHATVTRDLNIGVPTDLGFTGSIGITGAGSNDFIMDPVGDLHFLHSAGVGVFTYKYWKRSIDNTVDSASLDYRTNGAELIQAEYNCNLVSWKDEIRAFVLASEVGFSDKDDLWTFSDPEALDNNTGASAQWNGHSHIVGLTSYEAVT